MFKTLIAGATALSLTLASATPSQARGLSEDDIGKILFGLVAAATLNAAINNNRNKDRSRVEAPVQRPRHDTVERDNSDRVGRRDSNRNVLPRQCLTRIETRHGTQRIFGRRCLRNNYERVAQLPRECAVRIRTNNGNRRGFDARCLRQNGFSARR